MILASTTSTGYKIVLVLHIVFVVAAFGGLFAAPILARVEGASQSAAAGMVGYLKRIAIPSAILAGILGIGMISMSKDTVGGVPFYTALPGVTPLSDGTLPAEGITGNPAAEEKAMTALAAWRATDDYGRACRAAYELNH